MIAILVAIPGGTVIYDVLGLVIFGGFTIFDFNRLRRASMASSVPIAASIFLDIFNAFLLLLSLLGAAAAAASAETSRRRPRTSALPVPAR